MVIVMEQQLLMTVVSVLVVTPIMKLTVIRIVMVTVVGVHQMM